MRVSAQRPKVKMAGVWALTFIYRRFFMTVKQVIEKVDLMRQNQVHQGIKIGWLSQLDGAVRAHVINLHEQNETMALGEGADVTMGQDTILLVPAPYDEIYSYWLLAQLDFAMSEIARYNNSMALYNEAYTNFAVAYKQTHRPIERGNFVL